MNLILWRHAEAENGSVDMQRALTARGRKQADRIARWLTPRLPDDARIIVSPARRARETADALGKRYEVVDAIAPGARAQDVMEVAGWPEAGGTVLVVGHQPTLGAVAALALTGTVQSWSVRKAGLWWLQLRERDDVEVVVRAVVNPDLLDG